MGLFGPMRGIIHIDTKSTEETQELRRLVGASIGHGLRIVEEGVEDFGDYYKNHITIVGLMTGINAVKGYCNKHSIYVSHSAAR